MQKTLAKNVIYSHHEVFFSKNLLLNYVNFLTHKSVKWVL